MLNILNYLTRKTLLVNLVVALLLLMGYYTLHNLNREAFPDVNFDMVNISTVYAGASP